MKVASKKVGRSLQKNDQSTKVRNKYGWLLRMSFKMLRYFGLILLGWSIACVLSSTFGAVALVSSLFSLTSWFLRFGVVMACFMTVALLAESLR